jgi:AcrR family transcriptional regulator
VGGFYARVKDKNELLRALEERFFQELALRVERISDTERWIRAEIPEIVSACVAELISVARARHNLILAFVARSVHDEEFREEALRFRRRVSERISNVLYPRRDQLRHPDPELAIDLGVQFALSLVFQRTVTGETQAGGRTLSDAELGREIERSFLSYVGFAGVVSAP